MCEEWEKLERRLMLPPGAPGCTVLQNPEVVDWAKVKAEGSRGSEASRMARLMARDHFVVAKLPDEEAEAVEAMWDAASEFGAMDTQAKYDAAGRMWRPENLPGVVGFGVMEDGNEFLELRVDAEGGLLPGREGLDAAVQGFSEAMKASRSALTGVGVSAVEAACFMVGRDVDRVRELLELEGSLDPSFKEISATQHRWALGGAAVCEHARGALTAGGARGGLGRPRAPGADVV